MFAEIISGVVLISVGAVTVYLSRFLLNKFLPKYANETGILIAKLIGFTLVVVGALTVFFIGVSDLR